MKDFHDVENFIPVIRTLQGALAPRSPLRYFAGPENYAITGVTTLPEDLPRRLRTNPQVLMRLVSAHWVHNNRSQSYAVVQNTSVDG